MTDPAVCCFLTKTICAQGGRLKLPELQQGIGLSAQQLEDTLLAAGSERFLMLRDDGGAEVLAVSAVRTCTRKECEGCEQLHLCKLHLMGKCNHGVRFCKYSHDIINAENKKVLKTHNLSSLNENELRVLLLQNDPFFLPDVCHFYNRKDGTCNQQNNCNRLHVCRHFLQGECRFFPCKRSHNLLDPHALRLLGTGGIDMSVASNIQAIYDHRHVEFNKKLKRGKIPKHEPRENVSKKPAGTRNKGLRTPQETAGSTPKLPPLKGLQLVTSFPNVGPFHGVQSIRSTLLHPAHPESHKSPQQTCSVVGPSVHGPQVLPGACSNAGNSIIHMSPPAPAWGPPQASDKKHNSSAKASNDDKEEKSDEICLFYVWKYCKHRDKCRSVHYHLPYRWQIHDGITWNDVAMMEEIEKAYCDPQTTRLASQNINFQTMTCSSSSLRRLSTPSSVTKPLFELTTKWIWYWKNDQGQWIEYGKQGEGSSVNSPSSDVIENLYLADPGATIPFQAGSQHYNLNFKEMTQTNISFKTKRQVCRRPKFVSSEEVQKIKKGQRDSSIPNQACPSYWDSSALPDLGYKAVEMSNTTSEYNVIKVMFLQTMKHYSVLKILRIQNPSLWKVFQWQKEQMKRQNGGKEVKEKLLFHGTKTSFRESICVQNFDWRTCGTNGIKYGYGSYFARDASYSHTYCEPEGKTYAMFVARVLVGEHTKGTLSYVRPPPKSSAGLQFYDSCVDNELNPSIFVVFEKHQIYPEYIIEYKEEEKACVIS
ncbi:protein mono-ADP-ribosyltransferase PARP12-like isoform 1-T1 [Porphyrio hochstetteri]